MRTKKIVCTNLCPLDANWLKRRVHGLQQHISSYYRCYLCHRSPMLLPSSSISCFPWNLKKNERNWSSSTRFLSRSNYFLFRNYSKNQQQQQFELKFLAMAYDSGKIARIGVFIVAEYHK